MSYSNLTKGRVSLSNHAYLITTVCQNRTPLFNDIALARIVICEMRHIHEQGIISSLAFVLTPDHLHWLFCLQQKDLSWVINQFKGKTARTINKLKNSKGSVWQRGFHDHAIRGEDDIKSIARYIVANPLRAGIVRNITDYPHWDAIWLDNTLDG